MLAQGRHAQGMHAQGMHAQRRRARPWRRGLGVDDVPAVNVPGVDIPLGHGRGLTWFGGVSSETEILGADGGSSRVTDRWSAGELLAAARTVGGRLLPVAWRVRLWPETSDEAIVTTFGPVEIRRVPACQMARTCVKGDAAPALETASRRLLKYLDGDNQSMARPRAMRPIEQQQIAPGRWLIGVRLTADGGPPGLSAPRASKVSAPRASKVKVTPREAGMLAVIRFSGRPAHDAITRADAILLNTMSGTDWVVAGAPLLRLGTGRWYRRGFEVAVPVIGRDRAAAND